MRKNTWKPRCYDAPLLAVTHKAGLHLAHNIHRQHSLTNDAGDPAGVKAEMIKQTIDSDGVYWAVVLNSHNLLIFLYVLCLLLTDC